MMKLRRIKTLDEAKRECPSVLIAGIDHMAHETVFDYGWTAQHQIYLYEEGEDADIKNAKQCLVVANYAIRCGVPPNH